MTGATRGPALLAGVATLIIGAIPPVFVHRASGDGGLGHIDRPVFLLVALLAVAVIGLVFAWQVSYNLGVAARSDRCRSSEALAAAFAGLAIFGMLAALLPFVLWWRMVNDDTSVSDRGIWFFLAWVGGYALAAGVGLLAAKGLFGAGRAERGATAPPLPARGSAPANPSSH